MKLDKESNFQPVTLKLETQKEVDFLCEFLASNKSDCEAGKFIDELYGAMQKYRKFSGYFQDEE